MIVKINTHPIVVGSHEEYDIDWCGTILNTKPKFQNGKPIFYIKGCAGWLKLPTTSMKSLERAAQKMTNPQGPGAITTDKSYIYILEEDNKKTLLGIVTHRHIREYRQMYDKFEFL